MTHVVVVCDIGPTLGSGHAMRCFALAQELLGRGWTVDFAADVASIGWVERRLKSAGIGVVAPVPHDRARSELGADAIVVDSYVMSAADHAALRTNGVPVLALVDHDLAGALADVYVDQNLGAELEEIAVPPGSRRLAGVRYALMRDDILAQRPRDPSLPAADGPPRVLGVFGGTDPVGATVAAAEALVRTGSPFVATMVAARPALADALARIETRPDQEIVVVSPLNDLAHVARQQDIVLSAAGSSSWELLCLGVPTALLAVADNQLEGMRRAVAASVVAGLGDARHGLGPTAVETLVHLLQDHAFRARLARAGWEAVDGEGRRRVADAFAGLGEMPG
ncbi:PseG/SpsG family protein [Mumia sp. zg.B21]|uniref:PseG/SpsG family protein n=1 Tax=Mumia sp. zg.B21 TaxID=2855447 RepID=UPI00210376C2|nr:spore coat protein [Mumia sp. zg.B21]